MATTVAVTGAAGQIGYALLFRIASGHCSDLTAGPPEAARDPAGDQGAEGAALELRTAPSRCSRASTSPTMPSRPSRARTSRCSSVPARARGHGARRPARGQRRHLHAQGEAIDAGAASDINVRVVGNPANTNALIAASKATACRRALHRDDATRPQPRDRSAGAEDRRARCWRSATWRSGATTTRRCTPTCATRDHGERATDASATRRGSRASFRAWASAAPRSSRLAGRLTPRRAASAAVDHVYDWVNGTAVGDWVSMAVPSDGSYDVPEGIITSFPVTTSGGEWKIVRASTCPTSHASASRTPSTSSRRSARRSRSWASSRTAQVECLIGDSPNHLFRRRPGGGATPRPDLVTLPSSARPGITRYR